MYDIMSNKRSSRNTKKVLKALKHKREKYNLGKLAGIGKYANSPRARAMKAAADRKAAYYQTDEGKTALATKKEADKKFKEEAEEAAKIRSVEFDEAVAKGKQTASEGVDARQLELDRQAKVKADKELSDYQSSEEGKRKAQ